MLVFAYASVKFGMDIIVSVVQSQHLRCASCYKKQNFGGVAVVLSKYLINGIGYHGNII